jgi:hypothetical protein
LERWSLPSWQYLPTALLTTTLASPQQGPPPNIVFIMMDDLRYDDMPWLPTVQNRISRIGTRYTNFYAPLPLCCPSRVSTLRASTRTTPAS